MNHMRAYVSLLFMQMSEISRKKDVDDSYVTQESLLRNRLGSLFSYFRNRTLFLVCICIRRIVKLHRSDRAVRLNGFFLCYDLYVCLG